MTVLQDYLTQTRRLLHDASSQFWSDSELTDYINEARNKVVADTGCVRITVGTQATATAALSGGAVNSTNIILNGAAYLSVPTVTFSAPGGGGVTATGHAVMQYGGVKNIVIDNPGTLYGAAPTVTISPPSNPAAPAFVAGQERYAFPVKADSSQAIIDVLGVAIIWGTQRVSLGYMPYSTMNKTFRYNTSYQQNPVKFSIYGYNLIVTPVPNMLYSTEWDAVILPAALSTGSPAENDLIFPWTEPVKYYASYLANLSNQRFDKAEQQLKLYQMRCGESVQSSARRRIANA